MFNIFKKIKNKIIFKKAVQDVIQIYQSSLINLPIFFIELNKGTVNLTQINKLVETNKVFDNTNIIIQIYLDNNKESSLLQKEFIDISSDLSQYFTIVRSNDNKSFYISGSVIDYDNFFKYTKNYSNIFLKAILKEINENTYEDLFYHLSKDGFMNYRKFSTSYKFDKQIQPINLYDKFDTESHIVQLLDDNDFIKLKEKVIKNSLDVYSFASIIYFNILTMKESKDKQDQYYINRLIEISDNIINGGKYTILKIKLINLMRFIYSLNNLDNKPKYIKELYRIACAPDTMKDDNLFTPRYKIEQIQPKDPDEIIDEPVKTQEHRKNNKKADDLSVEEKLSIYENNIDNPEGLTQLNLNEFYSDNEIPDWEDEDNYI